MRVWIQRQNLVCQNLFNHDGCIDEFDRLRARLLDIVIKEGFYHVSDVIRTDEQHIAILFRWKAKMHPISLKGVSCIYLLSKFPSEMRELASRVVAEEQKANSLEK